MSFQHDSPWTILDPRLKNFEVKDPAISKKPTYLDVPLRVQQKVEKLRPKQTKKLPKKISVTSQEKPNMSEETDEFTLENCLKEVEEIDTEFNYYKKDIYAEKKLSLKTELLSLKHGMHPVLIDKDREAKDKYEETLRRIEDIYNYQKEVIEKLCAAEEKVIKDDIDRQIGFADNIVNLELKKRGLKRTSRKRKEEPLKKPVYFEKFYLKKKVSRLQSVHERQTNRSKSTASTRSNLEANPAQAEYLALKRMMDEKRS